MQHTTTKPKRVVLLGYGYLAVCLVLLVGCGAEMNHSSQLRPYEASSFFPNEQSARPLSEGVVARGGARTDEAFYTGKTTAPEAAATATAATDAAATATAATDESGSAAGQGGQLVTEMPFPVTNEVLARGQKQFNVYCAPCHGLTGSGDGMIVARGFPAPPSFHQDRLREAPVGHYFDAMTNGFGRMYSYASRVTPSDRWAIVAYIRALQLSQDAKIDDVPADQRQNLAGAGQ